MRRKLVLDTLLARKPLTWNSFDNSDVAYIKLMCFCMVPKQDIFKMYGHISRYQVLNAMKDKKVFYNEFNPSLIGIEQEDYDIFTEMCESINLKNSTSCDII